MSESLFRTACRKRMVQLHARLQDREKTQRSFQLSSTPLYALQIVCGRWRQRWILKKCAHQACGSAILESGDNLDELIYIGLREAVSAEARGGEYEGRDLLRIFERKIDCRPSAEGRGGQVSTVDSQSAEQVMEIFVKAKRLCGNLRPSRTGKVVTDDSEIL